MAQMDIDLKVQNEVENQRTLEQQLGSAFDAIDKNNSGYVNSMEFDEVLMQEFVTSWFATVGFDVETPEEKGKLWAVLEAKSPGVHGVEREAFIRDLPIFGKSHAESRLDGSGAGVEWLGDADEQGYAEVADADGTDKSAA
eukprot:CAMPEP_0115386068 /NCGR_PEP_ID=MMETSP0271-20121206/7952_1 /TAXON_ID=71861 /ORGANISM="Scrippsiella trochoidea, Strain CCMP3099" /LENGTH=140 /DNA_ID=CAMNT_0002809481 /DNA_START=303 /DNA_END=724 /DNA_ORIENTATION=-